MKMLRKILFLPSLMAVLLFVQCEKEGNVDGDNSFNLFTIQDDIALGQQVAAEIEANPAEYPILSESAYPIAYGRVNMIRNKILNTGLVNYKDQFAWQVKIIHRDDVVNAFAVPGGYLYFYTGLIKLLDNESQFAGVMAHEMAHVARRHSTDQLTKVYGIQILLSVVLGENPGVIAEIASGLASGLASLAFSRSAENEADEYAVKYLYATDYNAPSLADFFTIMHSQQQVPVFLSTHPSPDNRIEHINEVWQSLGGQSGQLYQAEYQQLKNSLP
jgi:beta-barrel assembly-enhancing protease